MLATAMQAHYAVTILQVRDLWHDGAFQELGLRATVGTTLWSSGLVLRLNERRKRYSLATAVLK